MKEYRDSVCIIVLLWFQLKVLADLQNNTKVVFTMRHLALYLVGRINKIGEKVMSSISMSTNVGSCIYGSKAQKRILEQL